MPFQALLGPQNLKSFTKCLTCLSRYGDDLIIQAGENDFILSAMNSAKTAFCRVKLNAGYFDKYKMTALVPPGSQTLPENLEVLTGQLVIKSLLSILRHKTVEKTVDRCSLSITEGGDSTDDIAGDNEDNLETKLIVRLHCKHGVVKTHKLLLLDPNGLIAPRITSSPNESQIIIGPRALKDIIEHFPQSKGTRSDPQLVWLFAASDVKVKTLPIGSETKGSKSQISTEISINADEFDSYEIYEPPVSLGFLLREFNATIALAESLSVALHLRFTQSSFPIIIEFDTDPMESDYLFVISTTDSVYDSSIQSSLVNLHKRVHDGGEDGKQTSAHLEKVTKKSRPAASLTNSTRQAQAVPWVAVSQRATPQDLQIQPDLGEPSLSAVHAPAVREPLFMPGASQLSNADLDLLRESGLKIEHMGYDEFEQMMEGEGEEVGTSTQVMNRREKVAMSDDEMAQADDIVSEQLTATQAKPNSRGDKEFQPLFDD